MPEFETMLYSKEGSFLSPVKNTAVIKFNRLDSLNAINDQFLQDFSDALDVAEKDPDIRSIVVASNHDKVYCTGADLKMAQTLLSDPDNVGDLVAQGQQILDRLATIPKVTIAAVNGLALGGGLEIALACDIRLMSEDCTWSLPEAKFGLIADVGGTARLAKLLGQSRAMEILMTTNRYTAQQALEWGLINYFYPTKEALFEGAEKLAQDIIKSAPLLVGAFKKIIKRGEGVDLMTHLDMEVSMQSIMIRSEDFKEGVTALMEKRDPVWKRK